MPRMKCFPSMAHSWLRSRNDNYTSPVGFLSYTVTALCQRHMATWLNVNIVLIGFTKTV